MVYFSTTQSPLRPQAGPRTTEEEGGEAGGGRTAPCQQHKLCVCVQFTGVASRYELRHVVTTS